MAIYHLEAKPISRGDGKSAVACAAYRSASELVDELYGKTHDYTRKEDVVYAEILIPVGAPERFLNREKLWNEVEAFESRKDAQLAREIQFSLPRELSISQNIALAREYVEEYFVKKGMIADLAIHNDKMENGERQPHAHVMLTMREVTSDGFGQKERAWNSKAQLMEWREGWAEVANRHLFLAGQDLSIDHRSYKDQGIEGLEPQYKIGPAAAGDRMARMEDHQRIARENGEAIFEDPTIALNAITKQRSTFTHQDLARFINTHTLDAEQFERVYSKVKASPELVMLGRDPEDRERYTTQEVLNIETNMITHSKELAENNSHQVTAASIEQALGSRTLTDEQKAAFDHITASGDLKVVIGYAGTGKSYLLGAAREAWEESGYRVMGAALAGKAAEGLESSSGIPSRTVASLLYRLDHGMERLTSKDILVIDEAGMLGSRKMAQLVEATRNSGAKLILVGDYQQLQAIEYGGALWGIADEVGGVKLTEIRRQEIDWQKEATKEFAVGNVIEGLEMYKQHGHVHEFHSQAMAQNSMMELWNERRIQNPTQTQIVLAYTRLEVQQLNEIARDYMRQSVDLGHDHKVMTERGERMMAMGDRIYFLANNKDLGVMNGSLGTIEKISDNILSVRLDPRDPNQDEGRLVRFNINEYAEIDHGYAATIHKSQGVTVDRGYLLPSHYLDAHAAYVAGTRHKLSFDIYWSHQVFENDQQLFQTMDRDRKKDLSIDYIEKPAEKFTMTQEMADQVMKEASAYEDRQRAEEQRAQAMEATRQAELRAERERQDELRREEREAQREAARPQYEKDAHALEQKFEGMEEQKKTSRSAIRINDEMQTIAVKSEKNRDMMEYIEEKMPDLNKQIKELVKEFQREKSLEREIEF